MQKIPSVTSHGASIPAIGLGTWPMKGEQCAEIVATAIRTGYRHIDTAAMYDNEEAVGEGLRAGGIPREDIWVTTKVWWDSIGDGALQRSAEASLRRLGLQQLDLLLIHWPSKTIPMRESIKALNDAKRRGLTKHIGVSNFPTRLLAEAVALTSEPLVANQCEYHPHLDQVKVVEACRKHGIAFVSYCPLGRGAVGGLLDEPAVKEIAGRVKRTPGQVVLRWHVQQPGVVAVPKTSNRQRLAENLAVFDFELTAEDMKRLSSLARADGRVVKQPFAPEWD